MKKYLFRRILFAIPTIIGAFIVVFFLIRLLPGDPAEAMLPPNATNAQLDAYRELHGLNESMGKQFWIAFKNFLKFDFGNSLSWHRPVAKVIFERFQYTLELALYAIAISVLIAIVLGTLAAVFRGKWPDLLLTTLGTLGMSLPTFYTGLWVLILFALKLKWIPVMSNTSGATPLQTLFGPLLTLVIGQSALLVRTTRSSMLEILNEDFIRTARSKGLTEKVVLFKHALGNALIPIITMTGYTLASSMGGAIVLETVFVRPGVGKLLIDAINVRDYPLIQGATVFIAIIMIAINILTDLVYGLVDPRIRVSGDES